MIESTLKCKNCGKKLVDIVFNPNLNSDITVNINGKFKSFLTRFKVANCIYCNNGESFFSDTFEKSAIAGSMDDDTIVDLIDTDVDYNLGIVTNILKVTKK